MLAVLATQHRIVSVDLSWEQRHAFVRNGGSVEGVHLETEEVFRFQQLREDQLSVVGTVCRVLSTAAILFLEVYETRVFDAVAFRWAERKDHSFGQFMFGRVLDFII